jgi:hypothetical protein
MPSSQSGLSSANEAGVVLSQQEIVAMVTDVSFHLFFKKND